MATGSVARMAAYVTGGYDAPRLPAHVDGAAWDELTATVSRTVMDSWESPSLYFRYRVKLGGEWKITQLSDSRRTEGCPDPLAKKGS